MHGSSNPVISLNPQTINLRPDATQNVQIVMRQIPTAGLSGSNITISIQDPNIAEITEVTFPGSATLNSNATFPSSSGWIQAVDPNKKVTAGDTSVLLGTITLKGKKNSTSAITLSSDDVENENGDLLTVDFASGSINPKSPAKTPVITWDNPADIYNWNSIGCNTVKCNCKNPTAANWLEHSYIIRQQEQY